MTAPMRPLEIDNDTICALATAHGTGAISIVRISGPRAIEITRQVAAFLPLPEKLESHKIYYGFLTTVDQSRAIDEVLISYFAHGRSFTGETSFEISCHGNDLLVDSILRELTQAGARPARRGEFTFRAFMNGRVDLVQAESVLALIESRSARAAQLALRQLRGAFSTQLKDILNQLTSILAHLEAAIDFSNEDIEVSSARSLYEKSQALHAQVSEIMGTFRHGRMISEGFEIALVGPPNAGKSSLLNALAGEERAIVTPVAGTTRDFVEASLSIEGSRVLLVDTAGLRRTDDPVEKIGVTRTLEKMSQVDLIVLVVSSENELPAGALGFRSQIPWVKTLVLVNKVDLHPRFTPEFGLEENPLLILPVSAASGVGLKEFKAWLKEHLGRELGDDSTLLSNVRHFQGLESLANCLERALPLMLHEESPDLIALELQGGLRALYEILGLSFDDQVMDRVFAEFCLGK